MMRQGFADLPSALDVLAEHSAEFRRNEAMRFLRRELVELCFQSARGGMANPEVLSVIHEIANPAAPCVYEQSSATLMNRRAELETISEHASWTTDAKRFLALAADAYQDAAKKLAADEPKQLRRAS